MFGDDAGRLAAEQEDVVRPVAIVEIAGRRGGREQNEAVSLPVAPTVEIAPGEMAHDLDGIEVVHPGAAEGAVGCRESGRLDDMGLDAEAGAQAENRTGILRNIRLVESDAHGVGRSRKRSALCGFRRRDLSPLPRRDRNPAGSCDDRGRL